MPHLTYLRVKGFKSIRELEVEPSQINLITGRNNYGKTSFLESVSVLSDPEFVKQFEDRVGKLINVEEKICSISFEYEKDQYSLYDDFSDEKPELEQQEIAIRHARDENVPGFVVRTIEDIIELNEDYPLRAGVFEVSETEDREHLEEVIQNTVINNVSNIPERELLSSMRQNVVIFEHNGEEYPYIFLGESYDELRNKLIQSSVDVILNEFPNLDLPTIEQACRNMLIPRFGRGRFIKTPPPTVEGIKFKKEVKLRADEVSLNEENAAVRRKKIEDYIIDNNILEDMSDFSFKNNLVFTDDTGEYEIPYEFMGDGFKTIVGVLWELFDDEQTGNVLLLEEPENHMHPGYIEKLVEQLVYISKQSGVQLFITTHNYDFINAFISKHIMVNYREFLENNFKLIQFTEPVNRKYDYEQVERKLDELNLDLRGI